MLVSVRVVSRMKVKMIPDGVPVHLGVADHGVVGVLHRRQRLVGLRGKLVQAGLSQALGKFCQPGAAVAAQW